MRDFRLVGFDKAVAERYPGILVGNLCYGAVMNRDTPCTHCPIADCSDNPSVMYYDSFCDGFVEAFLRADRRQILRDAPHGGRNI